MSDEELEILERAAAYPYDANDEWWNNAGSIPPPPKDWAHSASRGVVADLTDRKGIKNGFDEVDEDVRVEIIDSLAEIIRVAHKAKPSN